MNDPQISTSTAHGCQLCGATMLHEFVEFRAFRRVTSDCRPWPAGGRLCICNCCGCVQKIIDEAWRREIDHVYAHYTLYDQAAGAEQAVFEQASGAASPRSHHLLSCLNQHFRLPENGRILDVGCGNGATLRAFQRAFPGWSLAGTELSDKYRVLIDELPGAEPLYTSPPHQVPGSFDLITMIHVLEHIVDPVPFLTALLEKLNPGGMLLVEVPNHLQNPVELLTVDHCTHFSPTSLSHVVEQSGYQTTVVATDWVPKEITLVARKADVPVCATPSSASAPSRLVISAAEPVAARLRWLGSVVSTARELARKPSFGLFGTSIAATWLFGELQGQVQFFVDEDPQRIGKQWLERRIYHPAQIPAGSRVFVALPSPLAEVICQRIARPGVAFDLPPRLELP